MNRKKLLALLAGITIVAASCGGHHTTTTKKLPPPPHSCADGVAGCNLPKAEVPAKPTAVAASLGKLIPDVSEYQGCTIPHGAFIFRLYEGNTEREDTTASCHARGGNHAHVWTAGYAFLRPGHGGCYTQAARAVAIANRLGGVQVLIADSEVPLPPGFVRCWLKTAAAHYPAVEYTCPGCGDEQVGKIWIADYPIRPPGKWIAHQFSDAYQCAGVFGDCSKDEGITSLHWISRSAKLARLRALKRAIHKGRCDKRRHRHEHLGPRCSRWFHEGDVIHKELRED